jgi:DNA polymerase V
MYETELIFDYAKEPSRDILCIDCKSFYASVECVRRGLHPLETKLVVMSYPSADPKERGSGLILASSPAAKKAYGISNISRARDLPFPYPPGLVIAAPQMRLYMQKNTEINNYLQEVCGRRQSSRLFDRREFCRYHRYPEAFREKLGLRNGQTHPG